MTSRRSATDSLSDARDQLARARQALAAARAGLETATLAQDSYLARLDAGLSTSASTMREKADSVAHAERIVPPAERAVERSEVNLRVAATAHLSASVLADERINGVHLVAARAQVAEHVTAALKVAQDYYNARAAALAEVDALGLEAALPDAQVAMGKEGRRLVTVSDELAAVHRIVNAAGGIAVEVGDDFPGSVWGYITAEPVADVPAAARQLLTTTINTTEIAA